MYCKALYLYDLGKAFGINVTKTYYFINITTLYNKIIMILITYMKPHSQLIFKIPVKYPIEPFS